VSYATGMRTALLVTSLVLALTSCKTKDKYDEVLDDLEALASLMCACTDKACGDKVQDDARAYKLTIQDRIGRDSKDKPSDAQDAKGRAADEKMRGCRKKLDPPAPATP
jgi:hypothetical protein